MPIKLDDLKARDEVKKTIPYWPYCERCEKPFEFDKEEPFAYCECGTTEWTYPRPASYVKEPIPMPLDKLDQLRFEVQESVRFEDPKDPKYVEVHSSIPPYKYWVDEAKLTAFYDERMEVLKKMNLVVDDTE